MKDNILEGLVALVTGASRGIGRAISVVLVEAGVTLMATSRTDAALQSLADDLSESGVSFETLPADLSNPEVPCRLIEETINRFGRLDILINNAGILPLAPVPEISTEDWDRVMAVNARAPFLLCREALPHLKRSDRGTIIQIASVVGEKSYPSQGAYTASKHALMGFSKVLAQEVGEDGIRVHTILPGGVDTDMSAGINPAMEPAELMAPSDIADIVMFLLTHRNNAVIDAVRVRRPVKDPWF